MNVPTISPTPAPVAADAPAGPAGDGERFAGALRAADRSGGRSAGSPDETAGDGADAPGAVGEPSKGRTDRPMTPAEGGMPPGLATGVPGRAIGNPHLAAVAVEGVEVPAVDSEGEAVAATLAAAEAIAAAAAETTPSVAAATGAAAEADVAAPAATAVAAGTHAETATPAVAGGTQSPADVASATATAPASDGARTASPDLPTAGPEGLPEGNQDGGEAPVPAASRTDASTWQGDAGRDAGPSASPPPDGNTVQRAPVTPTSTGGTDAPVDAGGAVASHTRATADGAIAPSVEAPAADPAVDPVADAPDVPFEAVRSAGAARPDGAPAGSVRDVLGARVAARVEQAVRALEMAPPPRDAVLEIEGMRLQVRLRGDLVRVVADQPMPNNWRQELASSLGERGFRFDGEDAAADEGPRGDGSRDGDRERGPVMTGSGASPSVRAAAADDAMRI